MKFFSLFTLLCFVSLLSFSQKKKMEWSIHANSGIFFFSGQDAFGKTKASYRSSGSPFGKKPGFSWLGGLSLRKLIQNNFIYGVGFEFQSLTSKAHIVSYRPYIPPPGPVPVMGSTIYPATGTSESTIKLIACNPFFGKRIVFNKRTIDIELGPELAITTGFKQKVHYTIHYPNADETQDYETAYGGADREFRSRFQARLNFRKLGVCIGYVRSFRTSYKDPIYFRTPMKVNSNFIKAGISYQL